MTHRELHIAFTGVVLFGAIWSGDAGAGWQTFVTGDGLPSNHVRVMLEDRNKVLWFGTPSGLGRYDGATWSSITTADGLPDDRIQCMYEDRLGTLWIGTERGGVSRHDGATWRTLSTSDGLANNHVRAIVQGRTGDLWFCTDGGGVSRYDGSAWDTFTNLDGLGADRVWAAIVDREGSLWFGTYGGGLSRYDGTIWTTFTTADGLPGNHIFGLLEDRLGRVWAACGGLNAVGGVYGVGIACWDGASWKAYTTTEGLASNLAYQVVQDSFGDIWVAHPDIIQGGSSRFDGARWRRYSTADGLVTNWVLSVLADRAGNVWLGTSGWGVSRYDRSSWRTFSAEVGPQGAPLLEDRNGIVWFGGAGGAMRYDGSTWLPPLTESDGLASNAVFSMLEDRAGNYWFSTASGVSRLDGTGWRTFTSADGLLSTTVDQMVQDRLGRIWCRHTVPAYGVSFYDGESWRRVTTELASGTVYDISADRAGNVWFACQGGVSRYDGSSWHAFRTADGLAGQAFDILEDHAGVMWFACASAGVSRYDGANWDTLDQADGLPISPVSVFEDRSGNLWFGSTGGVSRYDGAQWSTYVAADGLGADFARPVFEDRTGSIWFRTEGGPTRYEPDRIPPRTVFVAPPPPVAAGTTVGSQFVAAFGETRGIEFSFSLDGDPWSAWNRVGSWTGTGIHDGSHFLAVRSHDRDWNMENPPAMMTFEIDATPPVPVLATPSFGAAASGLVEIRGTAADTRFGRYGVAVRPAGGSTWISVAESTTPVVDGLLATWDTSPLPDGSYEIRLAVEDTLGLVGTTLVTVRVDNQAPFDEQTAPARVVSETGGDVYTLNGEIHLYFPPHAFAADARVTIDPVPADSLPETLVTGASRVLGGFEVGWQGSTLEKPVRLELSLGDVDPGALAGPLAIHYSADGTSWRRLGGTVEGERMTLAVSAAGRYALYSGGTPSPGAQGLSSLSFTPRVFSPSGTFADRRVGIGFTLGRAGAVTVRVHNRAGWVVREVARGMSLGAGSNLLWWDGRDGDGAIVQDGLYLVTVEALGETRRQPLAVVR